MPILVGLIVIAIMVFIVLWKNRKLLGAMVTSAVGGVAAIILVNLTGVATGITIVLNVFSVCVALILGVPGVIALLLMQMFW